MRDQEGGSEQHQIIESPQDSSEEVGMDLPDTYLSQINTIKALIEIDTNELVGIYHYLSLAEKGQLYKTARTLVNEWRRSEDLLWGCTDINLMDLPDGVRNALYRAGIRDVVNMEEAIASGQKIRGIGSKSLSLIQQALILYRPQLEPMINKVIQAD